MKIMHQQSENHEVLSNHYKNIHFVGIGGAGMSGIAEILLFRGFQVSGSDISENKAVDRLKHLGATVFQGHEAQHVRHADLVVLSSAIAADNPEVLAARQANIPTIPRARMLAEIMRNKESIAIAGTHGKTTTTGLAASILQEGGLDPTCVIGGLLHAVGTNAKVGLSDYFVAEADESDASFLYLNPKIAVVTNIDADHLWFYENDFERLKQTFLLFLNRLPQDGYAVLCIDDPVVREMLPQITCKTVTYGFSTDADWQISEFLQQGVQSYFALSCKQTRRRDNFMLNLPGEHNVLNATAAAVIAFNTGISALEINKALSAYKGTGRRFQILGEYDFARGKALIIDDYGHHPREIAATIKAAKNAWPNKRVILAFQPHRYSRTEALFNDFVSVLAQMDDLILLDIYPAGEKPLPGADGEALYQAVKNSGIANVLFVPRHHNIRDVLNSFLEDGDVLLMQGAGDVSLMATGLFLNTDKI